MAIHSTSPRRGTKPPLACLCNRILVRRRSNFHATISCRLIDARCCSEGPSQMQWNSLHHKCSVFTMSKLVSLRGGKRGMSGNTSTSSVSLNFCLYPTHLSLSVSTKTKRPLFVALFESLVSATQKHHRRWCRSVVTILLLSLDEPPMCRKWATVVSSNLPGPNGRARLSDVWGSPGFDATKIEISFCETHSP